MQPHAQAARDRITAYLDAMAVDSPWDWEMVGLHGTKLESRDLRLVLAALDRRPTAVIVCDHTLTEEQAEDLKRRFLEAQHESPIRDTAAIVHRYLNPPGMPYGLTPHQAPDR
jgi:hypothetical protein